MHANHGAVDHLHVAVMRLDDGIHQPIPDAGFSPAVEAVVDCRARPVTLRQVAPRRARAQHPENAVENPPIVDPRDAPRLVGKMRLDRLPLEIRQLIPGHGEAPSRSLNHAVCDSGIRLRSFMSLRPRNSFVF